MSAGYAKGKPGNLQAVVTAGRGVVVVGGRVDGSIRRGRLVEPSPLVWASWSLNVNITSTTAIAATYLYFIDASSDGLVLDTDHLD